jgi:hypothetical protein
MYGEDARSAIINSFCFFKDCTTDAPGPKAVKDAMLKDRHVAPRLFLYRLVAISNALLLRAVLTNAPLAKQEYAMAQTSPPCSQLTHPDSLQLPMRLPLRVIMRSSSPGPRNVL